MTKPITGVALMTLYEHGLFQLSDPVSRFIPSWRGLKVRERGPDGAARLVEPERPVSVRDVLMHTSGIGYEASSTSEQLGDRGERRRRAGTARSRRCASTLAELPLHFHPGRHWLYSLGTDVCARLVEVLSGQRFDDYLDQAIFEPLGMHDTGFVVPDDKVARLRGELRAQRGARSSSLLDDPATSPYRTAPPFLSGGGGLVSTTRDYLRFTQMLANGGELDGVRVLGRKTVELMSANHLPGGASLRDLAVPGAYGEVGSTAWASGSRWRSPWDPPRPASSARPGSSCGAARRRRSSGSTPSRTSPSCS